MIHAGKLVQLKLGGKPLQLLPDLTERGKINQSMHSIMPACSRFFNSGNLYIATLSLFM